MTESDWTTSTEPKDLYAFLEGRGVVSARKHALFVAAALRRAWHLLTDERLRAGVAVVEEVADGGAGVLELAAARRAAGLAELDLLASDPSRWSPSRAVVAACRIAGAGLGAADDPPPTVWSVVVWTAALPDSPDWVGEVVAGFHAASVTIRDLFCNPFRPVSFLPEWRTEAVVALARGVYDERAFERLPVLADALEDAGCANDDILSHCRGEGPRVRGCWVVDAALGRA